MPRYLQPTWCKLYTSPSFSPSPQKAKTKSSPKSSTSTCTSSIPLIADAPNQYFNQSEPVPNATFNSVEASPHHEGKSILDGTAHPTHNAFPGPHMHSLTSSHHSITFTSARKSITHFVTLHSYTTMGPVSTQEIVAPDLSDNLLSMYELSKQGKWAVFTNQNAYLLRHHFLNDVNFPLVSKWQSSSYSLNPHKSNSPPDSINLKILQETQPLPPHTPVSSSPP